MRQIIMLLAAMLFACYPKEVMAQTITQKLFITINGVTKTATLVDNAATQELVTRLQQAPVTVTLNSSGGFEIWGALGFSLTTSNQQITPNPATSCFTMAVTSVCSMARTHGAIRAWGILTGYRKTSCAHSSKLAKITLVLHYRLTMQQESTKL